MSRVQYEHWLISHVFFFTSIFSVICIWQGLEWVAIFQHAIIIFSLLFPVSYLLAKHTGALPFAIFISLTSICFFFLYAANSLSLYNWGDMISLSFMSLFVNDLPEMLQEYNYGFSGLILFFILIFTIILFCHIRLGKPEVAPSGKYRLFWLLCLITYPLWATSFDPVLLKHWHSEPVSRLFAKYTHDYMLIEIESQNKSVITEGDLKLINNSDKPNIIFIHLDAMRFDHTSISGYRRDTTPFINELVQKQGAIPVSRGLSTCSESICGMLGALGSFYIEHADNPQLIHQRLSNYGYRSGIIGVGDFNWDNVQSYLQPKTSFFHRSDLQSKFGIYDDYYVLNKLSKLDESLKFGQFLFLRFLSSHKLGLHFQKYQKYKPSEKSLLHLLFPAIDRKLATNTYDNYLFQADDILKKAYRLLKQKGYLENYLIVIYGDHGEALGEHEYYGHYKTLYQEEINVPIIFHSTMDLSQLDTRYATLQDIVPTVLDLLSLPTPNDLIGKSLLSKTDQRTSYHSSRTGYYAYISYTDKTWYKCIYNQMQDETELYELHSDPQETRNLTRQHPVLAEKYTQMIKEHFSIKSPLDPPVRKQKLPIKGELLSRG